MEKIRMGVIGLGGISQVHLGGILKSPDAELTAICDLRPEVLHQKGELYRIPGSRRFVNYHDLLECPEVDAVSICTGNDTHFQIARDAISHHKPFALEKPVTLNAEEARQLKDLVTETQIPNMVCFSYRFKAAARYARWLIQQGYLGKIFHVYVQYLQSWGISEEVPLYWRFQKEYSGSGALGDLGSHMIDLTRFLVGDFEKVCAQAGTFVTRRKKPDSQEYGRVDVDDYCNYLALLKGGTSATFAISRFAFGRGNYQRIEIYGSKGGLIYSLENDDTIRVCIGDVYGQNKVYQELEVPSRFQSSQMQSFFDIIKGTGDGLAASIADGYATQLILDAILRSVNEQKYIDIKEEN